MIGIVGACVFLMASCSKTEPIVGEWELKKIDYEQHLQTLPEELRELFKTKLQEQFERLKGKTFFVFKEDKSLKLISPNLDGRSVVEKGKYAINSERDSLFFDLEIDEVYQIDSLTENTLILSTEESPARVLILRKK